MGYDARVSLGATAADPPLGSEADETKPARSEAPIGGGDTGSADGL